MKQRYLELKLQAKTLKVIATVNEILDEYEAQGFCLTVRQLYYQLVSRDIIPNTERSYKNLTKQVNDGRVAGLIDWDMIEDRTRSFLRVPSWTSPQSILDSAARSYHMDMWENQNCRIYCVVEKDALVNVLKRVCSQWDIPLLAARGYPSASVIREFGQQDVMRAGKDQRIVILHLGDHDPSGLDMSRDLEQRVSLFSEDTPFKFDRLALNMDQIEDQKPPPNPAKESDARIAAYKKKYKTSSSWELDALKPAYLEGLVANAVRQYVDMEVWNAREEEIKSAKTKIAAFAATFV